MRIRLSIQCRAPSQFASRLQHPHVIVLKGLSLYQPPRLVRALHQFPLVSDASNKKNSAGWQPGRQCGKPRGDRFTKMASTVSQFPVMNHPSYPAQTALSAAERVGSSPVVQPQLQADHLISSLPLIRYLRLNGKKPQGPVESPMYEEVRPYRTLHPATQASHLVAGSFFTAGKLPSDPYFFIQSSRDSQEGDLQDHRVIAACYVGPDLCGHAGYVHGGLPFLLFDDVFACCAGRLFESGVAMTANMNIDFRKPAIPNRVYVYRAEVVKAEGRKAWVTGQMRCINPFTIDEMNARPPATSGGLSTEEEESVLVAEATALFVEPKFGKSMESLFSW